MPRKKARTFEVMVDTWGNGPMFSKGERVKNDDDFPYDLDDALKRGIVRELTAAEARVPATTAVMEPPESPEVEPEEDVEEEEEDSGEDEEDKPE